MGHSLAIHVSKVVNLSKRNQSGVSEDFKDFFLPKKGNFSVIRREVFFPFLPFCQKSLCFSISIFGLIESSEHLLGFNFLKEYYFAT